MDTMLRLQQNDYVKRSENIVKDRVINAKINALQEGSSEGCRYGFSVLPGRASWIKTSFMLPAP